jgi:hypothetical protein
MAAGDMGNNVNLISGANNGYISGWQLDSSSKGTGATLQMKLIGLDTLGFPAVNTFGTDAKWLCLINNHLFRGGIAGV